MRFDLSLYAFSSPERKMRNTELERQQAPVVIVAHQAVLRCLYAYFLVSEQKIIKHETIACTDANQENVTGRCVICLATHHHHDPLTTPNYNTISGSAPRGGAVSGHPPAHRHQGDPQSLRLRGEALQDDGLTSTDRRRLPDATPCCGGG